MLIPRSLYVRRVLARQVIFRSALLLFCGLLLPSGASRVTSADGRTHQSPTESTALHLWRELEPLIARQQESQAETLLSDESAGAQSLYHQLLFDTVDSALYHNPPISPSAEKVRLLLARMAPDGAAFEAKLEAWLKERKLGVGFLQSGEGLERLLYLYISAEAKNIEQQTPLAGAKPRTSRELTEQALRLAEADNNDLAIAACASNLAFYALQERRRADMLPFIERAEAIWQRWQNQIGITGTTYLRAEQSALAEDWTAAASNYQRAADLATKLPALRGLRISALNGLAWSLRNKGDQAGVVKALEAEVREQQTLLSETTDSDQRSSQTKRLSDLQIELGGALAALNRHAEAGEWYARADQLRNQNYQVQRANLSTSIKEWEAKREAAQSDQKLDDAKRKFEISRANTLIDTWLYLLNDLAKERRDTTTLVEIAAHRVAAARLSNDRDQLADSLEAAAKSANAASDFSKARLNANEALSLRASDPRRKYIYNSIALLGDIASSADDLPEAEARYREALSLTTPDALPAPFDLAAEPDAEIRRIRARMNAQERVSRVFTSLNTRFNLADLLQTKGNYREAEQEYAACARDIPKLYAAGAEDETELLKWINEVTAKAIAEGNAPPLIKLTDIAAHRQQNGIKPDADELERSQQSELIANGLRAYVAIKRSSLLHDEGDLDAAAKAYREAITQTTNTLGGAFPLVGAYQALSRIERERGNYDAAEAPLKTALEENQRTHDAAGIAGVLGQFSELRREQGRFAESRQLAEQALSVARTTGSRMQTAGLLRTLGRVESEQGGAALEAAEKHLRESLEVWREFGMRAHVAYTLNNLGLVLERRQREDEALAVYEEAVRLIEALTANLTKNLSAEVFNSQRTNRELYERLIRLLVKRGRAADALNYLERAKSKALVDALAGAHVNSADTALMVLINRVRTLGEAVGVAETAFTAESTKPVDQRDAVKVVAAQTRLAKAQKDYANAVAQLQRVNPAYASLVTIKPTDLNAARAKLKPGTLLLEYFPTADALYIFLMSRDQAPIVRSVPIKHAELTERIKNYRVSVLVRPVTLPAAPSTRGLLSDDTFLKDNRQRATASLQQATAKLYDVLLAPVEDEIETADTLLLVPAAELYYVPIHALGQVQPDGAINYLIERKRFAYLASADLINSLASQTSSVFASGKERGQQLLAFGNPDGSLPAATEEVQRLKQLFPGAEVFTGAEATMRRVALTTQEHVPYIHFATHGMINSLDPKESFLLLAGEPNRLSVRDIIEDTYKMSFDGTRLVTLSACQTSIGGWDPSAVYSSLSRAFSKAGAPTVVASLWSVNDASTRDTMIVFYKELTSGQSKAEALRRAQLSVMHDPRFAHPFYWAPFVILGDWR